MDRIAWTGGALAWLAGTLLWLAAWLFAAARITAARDGDAVAAALGKLLPPFVVTTCLGAFAAVPRPDPVLRLITLWTHHAGFSLLFVFLLVTHHCQAEAWWRARRGGSAASVARVYRRLWLLTEIVPAPVALAIFLTGLRLIWESAGTRSTHWVSQPWLLTLVVGFSVFFWDGVLGYRPAVRGLYARWEVSAQRGDPSASTRDATGGVLRSLQFLAHTVSVAALFAVGLFRQDMPTRPVAHVARLEQRLAFLPGGWPAVMTAVLAWAAVGLALLLVVRMAPAVRRWSRRWRAR
jgi:hypothetical protein